LDFNEARNDGLAVASGYQLEDRQIICSLLQKTMPVPHHSVFTGRPDTLPATQPTQLFVLIK